MSFHTARICKRLQTLFPVPLVVRHVVPESLHSCLAERLGFPVCLRTLSGDVVVSGAGYSAYGVDQLGHEVFSVVGLNVLGDAVRVEPVLQNCGSHYSCRGIPKRDASCHFGRAGGYDKEKGNSASGSRQSAE